MLYHCILFVSVFVCMFAYVLCVCLGPTEAKQGAGSIKLELEMAVSHLGVEETPGPL